MTSLLPFATEIYFSKHHENTPNKPFFMYLAFHAVHSPIQVPKKYYKMYNQYKHKESRKRRKMLAMVTALDDAVGKIIKKLKKNGLFENTLIFFSSDVSLS